MTAAPFTHERYRQMLRAGLAAGYHFTGFDGLAELRASGAKACLLRHDCDNDLVAAAAMAAIEAQEGVRSTYFVMLRSALYNLLSPINRALLRGILARGHWLGLHFDERPFADLGDDLLPRQVEREIAILAGEFACAVAAVSFHQPSRRILDNRVKIAAINTYDRGDMSGLHYTSDSNLAFRGGDPAVMFATAWHPRVQVLIHPEWWTEDAIPLDAKWERMLRNNVELMQDSLLEREATFTLRRHVTFSRKTSEC